MLLLTRVPAHLAEVKSGTSGSEDGSLHVHTEIQTEMKERFNPTDMAAGPSRVKMRDVITQDAREFLRR